MKEKIEIPLSKNKLFLGIGGSLLFVILGIWLFLNADTFQQHSFRLLRNPMVVKGVGILGIFFLVRQEFSDLKNCLIKKLD